MSNLSLQVSRELTPSSVQFSGKVFSAVFYVHFPVTVYPMHSLDLLSTLPKFARMRRQRAAGQFYGTCGSNVKKNGALPSVILELTEYIWLKIGKATSFFQCPTGKTNILTL
jgi:hypothetical protein